MRLFLSCPVRLSVSIRAKSVGRRSSWAESSLRSMPNSSGIGRARRMPAATPIAAVVACDMSVCMPGCHGGASAWEVCAPATIKRVASRVGEGMQRRVATRAAARVTMMTPAIAAFIPAAGGLARSEGGRAPYGPKLDMARSGLPEASQGHSSGLPEASQGHSSGLPEASQGHSHNSPSG